MTWPLLLTFQDVACIPPHVQYGTPIGVEEEPRNFGKSSSTTGAATSCFALQPLDTIQSESVAH